MVPGETPGGSVPRAFGGVLLLAAVPALASPLLFGPLGALVSPLFVAAAVVLDGSTDRRVFARRGRSSASTSAPSIFWSPSWGRRGRGSECSSVSWGGGGRALSGRPEAAGACQAPSSRSTATVRTAAVGHRRMRAVEGGGSFICMLLRDDAGPHGGLDLGQGRQAVGSEGERHRREAHPGRHRHEVLPEGHPGTGGDPPGRGAGARGLPDGSGRGLARPRRTPRSMRAKKRAIRLISVYVQRHGHRYLHGMAMVMTGRREFRH